MLRFFFTGSSILLRDSSLSMQSVSLRFRLLLAGSVRKLDRGGWLDNADTPDDEAKPSSWFTPETYVMKYMVNRTINVQKIS